MKKFKIIGPITSTEFEVEDDEMLEWEIIKIKDYENRNRTIHKNGREY